ncbi:hypothetical protein BK658_22115 [Pseudomonas brassicacearum]|uniref:HTH araC/xylS-type domain-containing protein n=1 Tax=Pseudomonas brassicacearum TaxID=930166 RepID=A0A423GMD8_9PSED|nr:hypothetical protein BK658_22115 [Pseudomonas brassicacearum]
MVADRGYYKGLETLACEQVDYHLRAAPLTSGSKAEGRFGKQDFIYIAASDAYRCPAVFSTMFRRVLGQAPTAYLEESK